MSLSGRYGGFSGGEVTPPFGRLFKVGAEGMFMDHSGRPWEMQCEACAFTRWYVSRANAIYAFRHHVEHNHGPYEVFKDPGARLALKSIRKDGTTPFANFHMTPWLPTADAPGPWLPPARELWVCESGYHCFLPDHQAESNWFDPGGEHLYVVELGGRILEGYDKLVTNTVRLLFQVEIGPRLTPRPGAGMWTGYLVVKDLGLEQAWEKAQRLKAMPDTFLGWEGPRLKNGPVMVLEGR